MSTNLIIRNLCGLNYRQTIITVAELDSRDGSPVFSPYHDPDEQFYRIIPVSCSA